jgi:urea transport system substrate-binding protein
MYPVLSFSLSEAAVAVGGSSLYGHYMAAAYFSSYVNTSSTSFLTNYRNMYGEGVILPGDAAEAAYTLVHLWKKSVLTAASFKASLIRSASHGQSFDAPSGVVQLQANQHVQKYFRVAKINDSGGFDIVLSTRDPLTPQPW